MFVKIVAGEFEMVVKRASLRAVDIRSVSVEAVMSRWLAFSYILAMAAEDAVS